MMKLPKLMFLTALLVALVAFTGCGAPAAAPSTGEQSGDSAAQAPADEQATIKWFLRWDQNRVDNVAKPLIERFQEEHPNVTVELENIGSSADYYTKLQTTVAGGTAPDVFYPATHIAYALASKGAILPIDDYIARDNIDLSQYEPAVLDLYTIDGKVYCLPLDRAALVVFYNKKMFDEAGVAYPQEGWTWDDFLATAQALTKDFDGDGQIDQFGVDQFRDYWPMVVWSNTGHGLFDDIRHPTKFLGNEPEVINSIQWVADLMLKYQVMPTDEQRADISDLFAAQKAAMQVVGHWRIPLYLGTEGLEFDFAPLPIGKFGEPVNRADGSCFAISAQTKYPDIAWEFVKFLAAPGAEGVNMLLNLNVMTPALEEFQQDERFLNPESLPGSNKAAFLAGKEHLFTMYDPIHPMYAAFDAAWKQELGEVWIGAATAEEAMARLSQQVEEMLANLQDYE
ncbi:extracellular solute-binding protein [Litorilinea aerophila]|nr:extracellular solute-binding protein [Litorilinea aerophila]MCC9078385.1 extracellular solute-binding protein [Litorilinea aerophila]GIV78578.1 MAG: ABC transporter [Litorilinea sp.]